MYYKDIDRKTEIEQKEINHRVNFMDNTANIQGVTIFVMVIIAILILLMK